MSVFVKAYLHNMDIFIVCVYLLFPSSTSTPFSTPFLELGELRESVLALQDLRPFHFRGGPRLILDEQHLRLMIRQIAQFHSMSYALKLKNPTKFNQIVAGIQPVPFQPSGQPGDTANLYTVLYDIGLSRFLAYVRQTAGRRSAAFLRDVDNLERRFGANPVALLEHLRRDDAAFSVIQHGDYNRNNVLFRYARAEETATFDNPQDVRMLDFQVSTQGGYTFGNLI